MAPAAASCEDQGTLVVEDDDYWCAAFPPTEEKGFCNEYWTKLQFQLENNTYNSRIIENNSVRSTHMMAFSMRQALSRSSLRSALLLETLLCWLQSIGGAQACVRWNLLWNPRILIGIIVNIMKIIAMENTERDVLYWICVPSCKSSITVDLAIQCFVTQIYRNPGPVV